MWNVYAHHISVISGKPEVHPVMSQWEKTFQKYNSPDFKFYPGKLTNKISPPPPTTTR